MYQPTKQVGFYTMPTGTVEKPCRNIHTLNQCVENILIPKNSKIRKVEKVEIILIHILAHNIIIGKTIKGLLVN